MAKDTKKKPAASASKELSTEVANRPLVAQPVQSVKMPEGFKVKKALTMPLLRFGPAQTVYVKLLSNIWKATKLRNAKGDEAKKEPPFLVEVVRIGDSDGVVMHMIVPAVLKSELENAFKVESGEDGVSGDYKKPGFKAGYVDHAFGIKSYPPRPKVTNDKGEVIDPGKSYRTFSIVEIEAE